MTHYPDTINADHLHAAERRRILERLNRARDEIASLEQALARLPETAPPRPAHRPPDTPLPIAAG